MVYFLFKLISRRVFFFLFGGENARPARLIARVAVLPVTTISLEPGDTTSEVTFFVYNWGPRCSNSSGLLEESLR